MEYTGSDGPRERDRDRDPFYPCDTFGFPAACARYRLFGILDSLYREKGSFEETGRYCANMSEERRLGCFHGLGNVFMWAVANGEASIRDVCLHGTSADQFVCIEGAMERMGKYNPVRALEVCRELDGVNRETCTTAAKRKMYSLEKDLSLYFFPDRMK